MNENTVVKALGLAKYPILLIGDGIRLSNTVDSLRILVKKLNIPVLSSRFAQDILAGNENYFGYIGSHGVRYANYILSKCDLIIALGNRLYFNKNSATFGSIARKKIICIDIDEYQNPHINADLKEFLTELDSAPHTDVQWLALCKSIKKQLHSADVSEGVKKIAAILQEADVGTIFTADVGNNQLLLSRAYEYSGVSNRMLYSKSFGPCGCSIPKAIGAYYASKKPVICFTGDQGLMFNLQELQYLAQNKIPVKIVLLNNNVSGMIMDMQKRRYGEFLHTTTKDGYNTPDFKKLFSVFGLNDSKIVNIAGDELPYLPHGNECWDFLPKLSGKINE